MRQLSTQEQCVQSRFACWCIGSRNSCVLLAGGRKAHQCQGQARAVWKANGVGGVGTGGPWPPKVPPLAFSHLLLRHRTQQQSGRGSEVTLCNCQELERGAGTGGRHRGWWGQNPGKSNRPREGYKLGRRPRCPGKVMREGGSGPAEGRRVLASGL